MSNIILCSSASSVRQMSVFSKAAAICFKYRFFVVCLDCSYEA